MKTAAAAPSSTPPRQGPQAPRRPMARPAAASRTSGRRSMPPPSRAHRALRPISNACASPPRRAMHCARTTGHALADAACAADRQADPADLSTGEARRSICCLDDSCGTASLARDFTPRLVGAPCAPRGHAQPAAEAADPRRLARREAELPRACGGAPAAPDRRRTRRRPRRAVARGARELAQLFARRAPAAMNERPDPALPAPHAARLLIGWCAATAAAEPWLGSSCRFEPTCSAYYARRRLRATARRPAAPHRGAPCAAIPGAGGFDPVPGQAPALRRFGRAGDAPRCRHPSDKTSMTDFRRTLLGWCSDVPGPDLGTPGNANGHPSMFRPGAGQAPPRHRLLGGAARPPG